MRGNRAHRLETLAQLTDLMSHRGPDGAGYELFGSRDGLYQIGFGHRRLSIIDVDGGAQPMWSPDRRICVIFNGEIYNYVELRAELVSLGYSFASVSDTEVIIEAYRAWGVKSIARLRGMFAFALWDVHEQKLVIVRDPFGKKPLFLAELPSGWLFSSEISPIIEFPGMDKTLSREALQHYLLNRYVPGPLTFFRGVKKLQPGCYGVWECGRLSFTRYFIPPIATTVPDIDNFDDAVSMFAETLNDAVRIRMRSDAPFGAYLSGGLDSSAVVATMARHSPERIRTFSVGFQEGMHSELAFARRVAECFDTDHHELVVEPDMFMDQWPTAVLRRGAPISEPADIPILLLSQMACSKVKMVLTGEGADELMGGYPKHYAEGWIELYQMVVPQLLHHNVFRLAIDALPYSMRRAKIVGKAAAERELTVRMRVWFGGITVDERNELLGYSAPVTPPDPYPFSARVGSNLRRTLFFDQTSWLPDNLLERGDRMMMGGSIEGRMPFMDIELASLVARLPDKFLIRKARGKFVLREAMSKILPTQILTRKKVGFTVPISEWFRGPYREYVRETLASGSSQILRICDTTVVRRLVDMHINGRENNSKILWSLINLELFLRAFKPDDVEALGAKALGLE
jgi:asparagine synthase (glutamine-hydrolysing)